MIHKHINEKQILDLNIKDSDILQWVKEAFLAKSESFLPHKISQTFDNGKNFFNTMPTIMPTIDSVGVKIVSRYHDRTPSIMADLLLYEFSTGTNLATIDATWITTKRTGAVAALAVETFAKKNFESVALIGLGETGKCFLDMFLINDINKNKKIKLYNYKDRAFEYFEILSNKGATNIEICETLEETIRDSDVIVSALTVAETELGKNEWYKEGVLVVPIHTRGFQNCDLFFDKVFADDTEHVNGFKNFNKFKEFNEIDNVLKCTNGTIGRNSESERILSYNIGIALHDIFIARKIYDLIK